MINLISEISQNFMNMIQNMKNISLNHFEDILNFKNNNNLPPWLIPVSIDSKRIYLDKIDEPIIVDDYFKVNFEDELKDLYGFIHENEINYKQLLNIYYNTEYFPLQNLLIEKGYKMSNFNRDYFRSCITEKTCTGVDIFSNSGEDDNMPTSKSLLDERRNCKSFKFPILVDNEIILET